MKCVGIYQIQDSYHPCLHKNFDKSCFSFNDYSIVYKNHIDFEGDDMELCEMLYDKSNTDELILEGREVDPHIIPSDLIQVDDKFYYCNTIGWKEITESII